MSDVKPTELKGGWHDLIRIERIGSTRRAGDNEFSVRVVKYVVPADRIDQGAFYAGDLNLYGATMTVQLALVGGHVRAGIPSFHDLDPEGTDPQRRVHANTETDFFRNPVRQLDSKMNIGAGAPVWEMCQLKVSDQPERWWARTYLGWVPHADLGDGQDVEIRGLPNCIYHPRPSSF